MSRINGDRGMPRIPSRADKVRVPLWVLLLAVAGKGLVLGLRWCWRHRVAVPVALGLVLFTRWFAPLGLLIMLVGLVLVAFAWWRVHARSFGWLARWVWGRVRLTFVYRWRLHRHDTLTRPIDPAGLDTPRSVIDHGPSDGRGDRGEVA